MSYLVGPCVYIITTDRQKNLYKIGFTTNMNTRLRPIRTNNPGRPIVVHMQYLKDDIGMKIAEKFVHYALLKYRCHKDQEWFETDNVNIFVDAMNEIAQLINNLAPSNVNHELMDISD